LQNGIRDQPPHDAEVAHEPAIQQKVAGDLLDFLMNDFRRAFEITAKRDEPGFDPGSRMPLHLRYPAQLTAGLVLLTAGSAFQF
jgi:hypothetical protein